MKIIVVRHGQTVANVNNQVQGHGNADLSKLGYLQANKTAEKLSDVDISAVYSSDLDRAHNTAKIIAKPHGLSVTADARLRECCFGEWEGLTIDEIKNQYAETYQAYTLDSVRNRAPGGERLEDVQARIVSVMNELADKYKDETVLLVAHVGPIKSMFCYILGADMYAFRKISVSNCSISAVTYQPENGWRLLSFNNTDHLDDICLA
jgi:broad specificity phosphatase PhoE